MKAFTTIVTTLTLSAQAVRTTYYQPNGGLGSCGFAINNDAWAVALASNRVDGGSHCGKGIQVCYNGNCKTGYVADTCPGCPNDGLDLVEGFFKQFAPTSVGVIETTWRFT